MASRNKQLLAARRRRSRRRVLARYRDTGFYLRYFWVTEPMPLAEFRKMYDADLFVL